MSILKRLMICCALLGYSGSASAALPACLDADIGCLRLHLADQQYQIQDLSQQRDSLIGQLSLMSATNKTLLSAAEAANKYAQSIAQDAQQHWYEKPVLWFALGFLAASAACIGIAAAINHVTR